MTSVAARLVKLPIASSDEFSGPNKKARTSFSGTPATAAAAHLPPLQTLPSPPTPWMMPAAAAHPCAAPASSTALAPSAPGPMMMPPMPFFMAPPMGMIPPQMMAMQACMMMQMQMQAMQAMIQQHQQQHASSSEQQSLDKPSAATAAAASLNYGSPLPCYPPFTFMPHMAPGAMCFPQAPASTPAPPVPAPLPVPHKPQPAVVKSLAPPSLSATPSAPVADVECTNLSDKDFAAFIDSFVGDEPLPGGSSGGEGAGGPCLIKLEALQDAGSMQSCSGSECTEEAEDHFSFSLDELLPWEAVTAQVASVLAGASPPCLASAAAFPAACPLSSSCRDHGPQDLQEGEGEESDLIFGVCPHLDSLLPGC